MGNAERRTMPMSRQHARPAAQTQRRLDPCRESCWLCDTRLWVAYHRRRKVMTLEGLIELVLPVRRRPNRACDLYRVSVRPEEEGHYALPHGEFGLDVIALVGQLRFAEHRSVPEIHTALQTRGVRIAPRSVLEQLRRYEELVALRVADPERLRPLLTAQGRVILALDGLQPDVGHEVLWVLRDCLSGEILLARSLLGGTEEDLVPLLREVAEALPVPIGGVISDGQTSIRNAVRRALPGVPHQLCQFHYLREAAKPVFEADRHAKVQLKKEVRGVRPIERALEGREDEAADVVRGYCLAVRSALTDDGRPPLCASGLKLHERLTAIHASRGRVAEGGGSPRNSASSSGCSSAGSPPPPRSGRRCAPPTAGSTRRRTCSVTRRTGRATPSAPTTERCSRP